MKSRIAVGMFVATATLLALPEARAQDAVLHHAQAGALLDYAEVEAKVLLAAINSRQFDWDLTQRLVNELKRTLSDAKKSVDRATELGEDANRPDMEKLRGTIKQGEDQIAKLAADMETQVKPFVKAAESEGEDDEGGGPVAGGGGDDDEGAKAEPNWEALKTMLGWLYVDVTDAQAQHAKVGKKIKAPALKPPAKPKGARPQ